MRRTALLIPILILILSACAPGGQATPEASAYARVSEVENRTDIRPDPASDFAPATPGDRLEEGGAIRTQEASRARLDMHPDGTIIRVGPSTIFTLEQQTPSPAGSSIRLNLLNGDLWIVLLGGSLQVDTESGSASVRGSLMSVSYDARSGRLKVTCLEGHCRLESELGSVELVGGQVSEVPGPGMPPLEARPMDNLEIDAWFNVVPEATQHGPLGPPAGTPGGFFPPQGPTPGPTRYELTNNCPQGGTWHWLFEGPQIITIDVPQGLSVTGELPPGDYYATDYFDDGPSHGPDLVPGGGFLQVTGCPEGTP